MVRILLVNVHLCEVQNQANPNYVVLGHIHTKTVRNNQEFLSLKIT